MELPVSSSVFSTARTLDSVSIPTALVEREMLKRALGNPVINRLPTLIPLFLIGYASLALVARDDMLALVSLQILMIVMTSYTALRVTDKLADNEISVRAESRAIQLWLFFEFLSGVIWGLMIGPIAEAGDTGGAKTVISITLIVTVALAAVVAADAPQLIRALLAGFAITAISTGIYHYDHFGSRVVFAIILFPPTIYYLSRALGKRAQSALQTEMENVVLNQKLSEALSISEYLSAHDSLTGLLNRRDFERMAEELRTRTKASDMAIIMVDLDHFKQINDRYGHSLGDDVLKTTARLMQFQLRGLEGSADSGQAIARWGGEEFIIALANCATDDVVRISENIRCSLENYRNADWPKDLKLSGSFGVTYWLEHEPLDAAIQRADKAMYKAKSEGRNRTRLVQPVKQGASAITA